MDRDRFTPLVLALLAVVALGAAAATLDTTNRGPVEGSDESGASGDASSFDLGSPPLYSSSPSSPLFALFLRVLLVLLFVVSVVGCALLVYEKGLRGLLPPAAAILVIGVIFLVLYYVVQALGQSKSGESGMFGNSERLSLPSGGLPGSASGATEVMPSEPSAALFTVLVVAVVGVAVIFVRATGDQPLATSATESDDTVPEKPLEVAAVGQAAGRAADNIESDTPLSNAVYRAWREMTDYLDVPRETSTPGEFGDAAVAAGMNRDDVSELTRLFEATRYGGIDASEEREQRALAALRRIEREYAEKR